VVDFLKLVGCHDHACHMSGVSFGMVQIFTILVQNQLKIKMEYMYRVIHHLDGIELCNIFQSDPFP
jgi:hypothetical protein